MFEYVENDQSTWTYQRLPEIPKEFEEKLVRISGETNGKPNLRVVKGNEVYSDTSEDKRLKYHCGYSPFEVQGYRYVEDGVQKFSTNIDDLPENIFVVPDTRQEELGLLRYVIERYVTPEELDKALKREVTDELARRFRALGFRYVTLDLHGYRAGAMNEVIKAASRES